MKQVVFFLCLSFLFASCSTTVTQKSNLTIGMIKTKIVEGQTNQTDVLSIFGAPNLVTTSSEGKEVWTYNKSSYDASSERDASGGFWLFGAGNSSSAVSSATTSSLDLMIVFDEKDIVEKYNVLSASY